MSEGGSCAAHQAAAVGACHRCGVFVCIQCSTLVEAHLYCPSCAARPDVDYLEAYRLEHWGRRDIWAWIFGVTGVLTLLMAATSFGAAFVAHDLNPAAEVALALVLALAGGTNLAWFFGQRWARTALIIEFALGGVLALISSGEVAVLSGLLLPGAVVYSAWAAVRTRLFFRIDVPREQLRRDWQLYHDNRAARSALLLGVSGLIVPIFGPMALGLGIWGLRQVNPNAHPPIGGRGRAIAGMVLGTLDSLLWLAVLASVVTKNR